MDNKERFIEIFTSQIHRPGAAELLEWLESTDFFEAPASTHYHGSYTGGLVEHSLNVYYELIGAGRVPGVPTAETYAVVALLHDICKADFYEVVTIVVNNLLEIVFAVLGASFTALVIPWLKDTGLPWLKEKRLYSIVKKFVEAAEKQAEAGTIDKATKKRFVVELLEANGITVTPEINAFIEAAVKELDLAEKNAIGEIGKIFSDAEQTPQN